MNDQENVKFKAILHKITSSRGLSRAEMAFLVPGQTIYVVLDGTYAFRPTMFTFTFIKLSYLVEHDPSSALVLTIQEVETGRELDVSSADFGDELQTHRSPTLRRIFASKVEADSYFEDVEYVYSTRIDERVHSPTFWFVYKPGSRSLGGEDPIA